MRRPLTLNRHRIPKLGLIILAAAIELKLNFRLIKILVNGDINHALGVIGFGPKEKARAVFSASS